MAKDDALNSKLSALATAIPELTVDRLTSSEGAAALGVETRGSRNPIYRFELTEPGVGTWDAIAFTLILNGAGRPASRVEALGQAFAAGADALFAHNPFLMVFDFAEGRFMAVSAATLFSAFASEAASRDIPYSETSNFSLTPAFQHRTITMYATVSEADIWWCGDIEALTAQELLAGLKRMRDETAAADVPRIEAAVKDRLARAPDASVEVEGGSPMSIVPVGGVVDDGEEEPDIQIESRVWRMILTAIRSSPAVILVGPPGTGKTALVRQAVRTLATDEVFAAEGEALPMPLWATPDESWTARDLIGGDTVVAGEIAFRPGWVLRSIEEKRWLVLDEANRADLDRIFGGLMTWLAGGRVTVGTENSSAGAKEIRLGWSTGPTRREDAGGAVHYFAGPSWRLLGTYNALDAQRVFRFGSALGRRFLRVPVPAPRPELFPEILERGSSALDPVLATAITRLYAAHHESEATLLGPALFLGIARYLSASNVTDDSEHAGGASRDEVLAEAYLVNVGTWLAQLEPTDRDKLRERTVTAGALRDTDWAWIESMLPSLA